MIIMGAETLAEFAKLCQAISFANSTTSDAPHAATLRIHELKVVLHRLIDECEKQEIGLEHEAIGVAMAVAKAQL